MESHCSSGALHVVLMLSVILEFSWMSAPVAMKRHKLQPDSVCLTFLAFYLPWRRVSIPDYKTSLQRCSIPISLVTEASPTNCKFCTTLMSLCRFHVTWCVSLEWHTNLPAWFCRVWRCFNIMLHFIYHEVFADVAALSSLTPTSFPQSTPHSVEDQDIQDLPIFPIFP